LEEAVSVLELRPISLREDSSETLLYVKRSSEKHGGIKTHLELDTPRRLNCRRKKREERSFVSVDISLALYYHT
jgi:hypothetical protein